MILSLLLLACTPDATEPFMGPELDPDVQTWLPATLPVDGIRNVLFLGDSVTRGFGASEPSTAYRSLLVDNDDDAWPEWSGDDLSNRYDLDVVFNAGRDGAQSVNLDGQISGSISQFAGTTGPTAVFITIGGNDLLGAIRGGGADTVGEEVAANIETAVQTLQDPARFPNGTVIFLANVYEPTDDAGQADECFFGVPVLGLRDPLMDMNARTLALAQEYGFAWVDIYNHFQGHGFNADDTTLDAHHPEDPTTWFIDDCIHPTDRGHHELRRQFLAAADGLPLELGTQP